MKTHILIVTIFLIISGIISCNKDTPVTTDTPQLSFTTEQEKILQSSNNFGITLFNDLADELPQNNNLFISPLSVYLALTMTYNGAASETATEMQNTLGYEGLTKEEINQSCKELANIILNADPKVIMEITNSIWHRDDFQVKQEFIDINKNYFDAEVNACNFADPATLTAINNWVKNKTHDKIEKILDQIPADAVMYLINAIYFKGTWKYKFDKTKTVNRAFWVSTSDHVMTPFMEQQTTFNYVENELLEAVELPYGNSGFSMVILLPKEGKSLTDLIAGLSETNWQNWNNNMDSTDIKVIIPRFKFAYDTLLNESLKTLGIKKAFAPDIADFSNINELISLYISRVIHKSFVEVNEDGTEAAAVTVVEMEFTAIIDQPKTFIANKPFVFIIKENTLNTILFAGLMNKPVSE